MMTIKDVADSFRTYEQMYDDLIEYGPESIDYLLDNDGIWKRLEMNWIIEYFIKNERFEECAKIEELKKDNFIAPEEEQARLNAQIELYKTLFK